MSIKLVDDGNEIEVKGGDNVNVEDGGSKLVLEDKDSETILVDDVDNDLMLRDDGSVMTVTEQADVVKAWFGPVGPRGPQGVPGVSGQSIITRTAGENMSALKVAVATTDDTVVLADINDLSHFGHVVGITIQAAAAGNPIQIQRADLIQDSGLSFMVGDWLYVGAGGALVSAPPNGAWWHIVGYVTATQTIDVSLREPIMMEA